ncbi:hypothetical protein LJC46_00250 [Desulfovibrio sp. OttesenSCG-928-G15]|nr:hypothetical protein [Desulfovibrio sp. OttesenSCG-928-G15]
MEAYFSVNTVSKKKTRFLQKMYVLFCGMEKRKKVGCCFGWKKLAISLYGQWHAVLLRIFFLLLPPETGQSFFLAAYGAGGFSQ